MVINKLASSVVALAGLLFPGWSVGAGVTVEIILDGEPIPLESMVYDFDNRVIDAVGQSAFECDGPQTDIGNGLVLKIDNQTFRLETARFARGAGVTRIIATTPGELPTCGPEGLIFQDYFQ